MNATHLLRTAAPILSVLAMAAAPPPQPVTPMTPDVVASYDQVKPWADFIRREVMIPMRDGTKLYTVVVMRKGTHGGPILLTRSPYDAHGDAFRSASQRIDDIVPAMYKEFVDDGYIIAIQDIRGLHRSQGTFIMTRPIAGPLNKTGIDESTDAYDTIDWLVKNVPESNGRVGTIGSSYLGFTTLMSEINPHPALKAAVPESPMVDTWMGDDDFHNGAFRVPSFDYFLEMSTGKADAGAAIARGAGDDYTTYLEAGSAGDFARKWGIENVPSVRKVMENPAYTDFWSLQAVDKWLAARPLTVPTMLEVGQWDQEDSYGAPAVYRALKDKYEGTGLLHLVIGPWRHSGANHYGYELGDLTFTGDTAREWRTKWMKPFLDHYLKGAPGPAHAERADLCDRHQPVGGEPALADGHADRAVPGAWSGNQLRPPSCGGKRRLCLRPDEAGAFPAPADQYGRRRPVAQLADPRPALRRRPTGCSQLRWRAADEGGPHHGPAAGRPVRFHQRQRQRLGGQADRRLSERHTRGRVTGRQARAWPAMSCRWESKSIAAAMSTTARIRRP